MPRVRARAATTLALAIGALAIGALAAGPAEAGPNDFRLNARKNGEGVLFQTADGRYTANDALWRSLVTELGYLFAPRLASPAETLGHSGFSVGAMWSGTFVSSDEPYWGVTERGRSRAPASLLQTLQLDVRKGLPLSLELGAHFMWLVDSELFAPGLELRWAVHEGFGYSPDVALRGSVSHLLGSRDLLLTTTGLDLVVSKGFGLFGMVHLAPYVSWSLLFIAGSSRVIDPTPTDENDLENNLVFREISATSKVHHKLTLGLRTIYSTLNVSAQGELQMLEDGFIGPVATLTTKLGLDF